MICIDYLIRFYLKTVNMSTLAIDNLKKIFSNNPNSAPNCLCIASCILNVSFLIHFFHNHQIYLNIKLKILIGSYIYSAIYLINSICLCICICIGYVVDPGTVFIQR